MDKPLMRPEIQTAFDEILDWMGGADGGVKFAQYMMLVRALDAQAAAGDEAADKVLDAVRHFHKLFIVAERVANGGYRK